MRILTRACCYDIFILLKALSLFVIRKYLLMKPLSVYHCRFSIGVVISMVWFWYCVR